MKKKVLALVLAVAMVLALCIGLVACNQDPREVNLKPIAKDDIKIGLICLHDENSTYDKNFIDAMKTAVSELGLRSDQLIIRTDVGESQQCYDVASDLIEGSKCNIIFADSFGHEDYIMKAAWKYTDVRFGHATGTKAHTAKYGNYFNAFASIYEGRYLAGVAAGAKLNEMITASTITAQQAKIGYVGAHPYAEVKSGYTSFYLGAKSVCPSVTMDVKFTSSWYDKDAEKATAQALIESGCKLISQHADSDGAPSACDEAGVPNVTYNVSMTNLNSYLVGSKIDWAPYYKMFIQKAIDNEEIPYDWTGTLTTGSVKLLEYGANVSQGIKDAVEAAKTALTNGTVKVFDCANFTVGGNHLTTYMADVDFDANFTKDTEAIVKIGETQYVFEESKHRSAPYFDIDIDGINLLN